MALTDSDHPLRPIGLRARIAEAIRGESMLMQRLAGAAFLVRVASAAVAFGSQILLARWMGSYEFGIYVYAWTWMVMFGQAVDFGLSQSAQRFVPEYRERNAMALLRGFLSGSRWFAVGLAALLGLVCAAAIHQAQDWLSPYTIVPLYLACLVLPAYALANVQDGIARSYDWAMLAFAPSFLLRNLLLIGFVAIAHLSGLDIDAVSVTVLTGLTIWITALGQMVMLRRRLRQQVDAGPKQYDFRIWLATSLPILLVEGFYLLLTHVDILVLQQFVSPDRVAAYYAAAKTLALVSFVYWSIAAATAHRFSAQHAAGQRDALAATLASAIRWTFWPSLAATLLLLLAGRQILKLFGDDFATGYPIMVILSVGLLARAALGPVEKLLNMLGEQKLCALVYGLAFIVNLALCLLLIPIFGAAGAALATAMALVFESVLLFTVTRNRLGFHVFIFGTASKA